MSAAAAMTDQNVIQRYTGSLTISEGSWNRPRMKLSANPKSPTAAMARMNATRLWCGTDARWTMTGRGDEHSRRHTVLTSGRATVTAMPASSGRLSTPRSSIAPAANAAPKRAPT